MRHPLKARMGEGSFRLVTLGSLVAIVAFLVLVVVSMITFVNWRVFFSTFGSNEVLFSIRLSFLTATVATAVAVLFAIPTSYAISKANFWGKSAVDTLLDIPIVVSPVALGSALLIFFNTSAGSFIETHFIRFVFEVPGIVLAQFVVVSALAIRLMKSTFDGIGVRYEMVARTLGCGRWQAFFRVTLPIAKNGLIAASIIAWARAVGEYGATITLAGATQMKTETLPIAIYLSIASADVDRAVACILILIGMSVVSLVALRKLTGKGYTL